MKSIFRFPALLALALAASLAGCVTPSTPVVQRNPDALVVRRAPAGELDAATIGTGNGEPARPSTASIHRGTGQVINTRVASAPPPALGSSGEATFNFEGESLHAVVKVILGDLLRQNYVIAPNVQGTVTLSTPRAVNEAQALSLLE
ncbi:MAG: type II secretion system protein GspD, partial [Arenimonas sp.]